MPCYEINTISVDFKAENMNHLETTLKNMGLKYTKRGNVITIGGVITINLDSSKVECPSNYRDLVNKIKREYSKAVIEDLAKKKKWALKMTGEDSFIMRRY
jgi:hypothetical protein